MKFEAPASLRTEHHELHGRLSALTKLAGRTGAAAREVADLLHPHFVKEESFALPPLGLLGALSRGDVDPAMREVIPLVDKFEAELPQMLAEHQTIVSALQKLAEAGAAEGVDQAASFVKELSAHAKAEEDVSYPAALLVGRYVKHVLGDR